MIKILLYFIMYIIIIAITMPTPVREGFNTYFRQTVRPHIRTMKKTHEGFVTFVKTSVRNIGRQFGILS